MEEKRTNVVLPSTLKAAVGALRSKLDVTMKAAIQEGLQLWLQKYGVDAPQEPETEEDYDLPWIIYTS